MPVAVDMPAAVAGIRQADIAKARDVRSGVSTKRVDVNEVKVRGRKGVLSGTPFLLLGRFESFQGFNAGCPRSRCLCETWEQSQSDRFNHLEREALHPMSRKNGET
jgi:hypothetical protein